MAEIAKKSVPGRVGDLAFGIAREGKAPAKIDYFATSLPTMLLFDEDLQARQTFTARFMQAQAFVGLGRKAEARSLLMSLLKSDPNHTAARDFIGFL